MKSKQKNRYILLVLGIVLGIIFFGCSKLYSVHVSRNTASDKIRAELGDGEFKIAVGNFCCSENTEVEPYIKWWYNWIDNKYYFFLPKSWEKDYRLFWAFNYEDEVVIEGRVIKHGAAFNEKEGEYTVKANDNEYQVVVMYSSDIASMFLETETGSLDYIHESKEIIEAADYILFDNKGALNNFGHITEISCRGNVSFKFADKKSYRMELQDKSQLLELGSERDWLLLANALDATLSRNMIVNTMAEELDMDYVPDMAYVDLYANGEYVGNYVLAEKIEVGSERVNIRDLSDENELANPGVDFTSCEQVVEDPDKLFSRKWWKIPNEPEDYTGGYLMEIEMLDRYGLEASGFITSRMQGVVVHNPKYASLNQIGYIADLYQDFEDALFAEDGLNENTGKYFYEYINMDSFAKKYMLEEVIKNLDASATSCFLYKPEYDTKMYAGPAWDYDGSIDINRIAGNGVDLKDPKGLYVASKERDSDIWWALYQQEYFQKHVDKVFEGGFKDTVSEFVETFIDENADFILDSAMMNTIRWSIAEEEGYDATVEEFYNKNAGLKEFLQIRLEWLDEEWNYEES